MVGLVLGLQVCHKGAEDRLCYNSMFLMFEGLTDL